MLWKMLYKQKKLHNQGFSSIKKAIVYAAQR